MYKPPSTDIIVVGGNAAGAAAAARAKRIAPKRNVFLLEGSPYFSTATCDIPYVVSEEIKSPRDLLHFTPERFLIAKNVEVSVNTQVVGIDTKNKQVVYRSAQSTVERAAGYSSLVLATGSIARDPYQLADKYTNHFFLKSIEDLERLVHFTAGISGKNAVILGAGYIGLEAAESFVQKGFSVTIIDQAAVPLSNQDSEVSQKVADILKSQSQIDAFLGVKTLKFFGNNVITKISVDGRLIECDLVVSALGVIPNTELAKRVGIKLGVTGAVKVSSKTETSVDKIYAAGDCCEITDAVTGEPVYRPLATTARAMGWIAGENAAGGREIFANRITSSGFRLFSSFLAFTGVTELQAKKRGFITKSVSAETGRLVPFFAKEHETTFGRLVVEKTTLRLLGASFIGGKEVAGLTDMATLMIQQKLPVSLLKDLPFIYSPPLAPFTHLLSLLSKKLS